MKFMKLGSSPDTFYTIAAVRSVSTQISSDLIVQVKGSKYLLHKAPLLSKCLKLQQLCSESSSSSQQQTLQLHEFPGGEDAFEACAKFCYGITITLSSLNIVSVRCAAEYLQMTEEIEKGNLIYKLEVFLNSSVLRAWKDLIVVLKSTTSYPSWSEELGITGRCIDAIASKVQALNSQNYAQNFPKCNGIESQTHKPVGKGWWIEDIVELNPELYWRTMVAIKSGRKLPGKVIGETLQIYASRHLPNISENMTSGDKQVPTDQCSNLAEAIKLKHRLLLESIVSLLPIEKGSVSCSFLLRLLKAANILGAGAASKIELARRVGMQLEGASVSDLLIPSLSDTNETLYDIDIVLTIFEEFMLQVQSPPVSPPRAKAKFENRRSKSVKNVNFEFNENRRSSSSSSHSSKLKVAKLIDGYIQEVAQDSNLPLSKMIALIEAIPDFARPEHDDLYKAIDLYLKSHPDLDKHKRIRLCQALDFKKLSQESCIHAVQNELLPLRVVVKVLLFDQARNAATGGKVTELPDRIQSLIASHEDDPAGIELPPMTPGTPPADSRWRSIASLKSLKLRLGTLLMKPCKHENQIGDSDDLGASSKLKGLCFILARPKWMLGSCI